MSNDNYCAVLLVLDSSGSMCDRVGDNGEEAYAIMQDALHMMLEQQARKLAGYLTVDVGYFENRATQGEQNADPMLINLSMYAGGGTQIFDSTATLVANFEDRLKALPADEQPGHVVVVVMTDGESYPADQQAGRNMPATTKRLIGEGWDFAYLAAGGGLGGYRGLGIPKENVINESMTEEGIAIMAEKLGQFVSMSRSGEDAHF